MSRYEHVFVTYIRTSPDELWDALTLPEFTRRYFHATEVISEWVPGAPVAYRMADGNTAMEGEVLEIDRPKRLAISWRFMFDPEISAEPVSRVVFEIEPRGDVCKLTVLHDRFEAKTRTYESVSGGWPEIIASLKSLLETGEPLPVAGNE